jgi:hypothetical protein
VIRLADAARRGPVDVVRQHARRKKALVASFAAVAAMHATYLPRVNRSPVFSNPSRVHACAMLSRPSRRLLDLDCKGKHLRIGSARGPAGSRQSAAQSDKL